VDFALIPNKTSALSVAWMDLQFETRFAYYAAEAGTLLIFLQFTNSSRRKKLEMSSLFYNLLGIAFFMRRSMFS